MEIIRQFPDTQLILLDDAFQHRYVKPKVNVMLMDYSRPVYDDSLCLTDDFGSPLIR